MTLAPSVMASLPTPDPTSRYRPPDRGARIVRTRALYSRQVQGVQAIYPGAGASLVVDSREAVLATGCAHRAISG